AKQTTTISPRQTSHRSRCRRSCYRDGVPSSVSCPPLRGSGTSRSSDCRKRTFLVCRTTSPWHCTSRKRLGWGPTPGRAANGSSGTSPGTSTGGEMFPRYGAGWL
ncbi:unnamed protein product, partial [Ectocarpus fasciculatus]